MEPVSNVSYMGLQEYMMPCVTKQVLGFDCPGCGLQRSILHLLNGEFIAAFQIYPAIYTLIPLAFLLIINKFYNFKYADNLIIAFSMASVSLIVINYIFKLLH